jgi:hypothetical protein
LIILSTLGGPTENAGVRALKRVGFAVNLVRDRVGLGLGVGWGLGWGGGWGWGVGLGIWLGLGLGLGLW